MSISYKLFCSILFCSCSIDFHTCSSLIRDYFPLVVIVSWHNSNKITFVAFHVCL